MKWKLFLAFLLGIANLPAADWPNWRGPNFDGISTETDWDPEKIDNVLWKTEVGTGFSGVAVANGRVYTLGHDGRKSGGKETVYCLDVKSGKKIWSDTYSAQLLPNLHEGGPAATPTIHGDHVYTLGKDGKFNCYLAESGKKIWGRDVLADSGMNRPADWGFAGSPLISAEMVIIEAAHTIAYDRESGKVIWKSDRFKPAYATPVIFVHKGRKLLVTLKTEGLVVLDVASGKTVAMQEWKTRFSTNATTPMVMGDKIFISTGYSRGCGLYEFTGDAFKEIYSNKAISNHMANCVLIEGHLYGITGNTHGISKKQLVCMKLDTGEVKWKEQGFGCGTVSAAGNKLVVLTERGELVVSRASPGGFDALSRAQVNTGRCWTVPVLANGVIYTRNSRGRLVAVGVGGKG